MSWRNLPPLPDEMYELAAPLVTETGNFGTGGQVILDFPDPLSRQWFAEWLKSKHCREHFGEWVDMRR